MLKQSELSEEEQAEAFRRADELFRRESEQARVAKAASNAAEELGIPQEYLDRAAAQVHAERVEKIKAQRRRRTALVAGLGFLAVGVGAMLLFPPRPEPYRLSKQSDLTFISRINEGTRADAIGVGCVNITVGKFVEKNGDYFANAGYSPAPPGLSRYRTVTIAAAANGSLKNLRLDFENGAQERWRSPVITGLGNLNNYTLSLDAFEHQKREGGRWRTVGTGRPREATNFLFKVGEAVNPIDATGEVLITELVLK